MTIQIRQLPFYVMAAIYLGVIYNFYYLALDYSFSVESLHWSVTGVIAATAILFLMLTLIMRPEISFLGLNLVMNNLNPPDPFKKHIYLFRVYYLVFMIQLLFVWNKGKSLWSEEVISSDLIMLGIYLAVLAYITFIYMNRIEPLLFMRERGRF